MMSEAVSTPMRAPENAMLLPATQKQRVYAYQLARQNQVLLPSNLLEDRRRLSKWIDHQRARPTTPSASPTSRQVAFAEKLSRIKRRKIPGECLRDRAMLSRWIDHNKS